MRPKEFEENREELDRLYTLYCAWENSFREQCMIGVQLPWLRELQEKNLRPRLREHFEMWFLRLRSRTQDYLRQRWEAGFEAWKEQNARKASAIERRIARDGIPVHIRECVEQLFRQLEERGSQQED